MLLSDKDGYAVVESRLRPDTATPSHEIKDGNFVYAEN